jgi:hypothetical protein
MSDFKLCRNCSVATAAVHQNYRDRAAIGANSSIKRDPGTERLLRAARLADRQGKRPGGVGGQYLAQGVGHRGRHLPQDARGEPRVEHAPAKGAPVSAVIAAASA